MKCEICKQKAAEVAVKQRESGEEHELFVCQDCARKMESKPVATAVNAVVELLLGAAIDLQLPTREEVRCPGCGLGRAELRKRGRVGCAACYETFARDLAPMLRDMHSGDHHVGKLPARERLGRTRAELETSLAEAIKAQRYEEAAKLRDRIRELDGGAASDKPPAAGGRHAAP